MLKQSLISHFAQCSIEIKVVKRDYSAKLQTVTFHFEEQLPAKNGQGQLKIKFNGTISDILKVFYRNEHSREFDTTGHHGANQAETTNSRRAFPSFGQLL